MAVHFSGELPCPIVLSDTAGQTYKINLTTQPPLTSASINGCSVSRPLNNGWCPNGGPTNGFTPNNGNYINTHAKSPGPRTSTHDFNGDGYSDILWKDTISGSARIWLYEPNQPIVDVTLPQNLAGYASVGQRDYDADGKTDLVWKNIANGATSVWFMNGTAVVPLQTNPLLLQTWGIPGVNGLTIAGTGDFNNDSFADILLTDGNGSYWVWLLSNPTGQIATQGPNIGPPPFAGGQVVGTGDFNGDGFTDILWANSAGNFAFYFMQGISVLPNPPQFSAGPNYVVVGTGDFDGDGIADIVLRWNGHVIIWLMNNNGTIKTNADLGIQPSNLSIAATGDYNRDGKSDLLWYDSNTGNVSIWFMNGTTVASDVPVGGLPKNWVIQSLNAN
jgi:FG-GAP-like repeat